MQFINVYMQRIHSSLPIIACNMLRLGVSPVELASFGLPGIGNDDTSKLFAAKATSWAVASLGASFSDVSLAQDYMAAAIRNMRQCFEAPNEESVIAYTMVGSACFQLGKPDLFFRYIEFAGKPCLLLMVST